VLIQPADDLVAVRGVADYQEAVVQLRDDDVVENAAIRPAYVAVAALPHGHVADPPRAHVLQQLRRPRSAQVQPPHVRHVEQRRVLARPVVLVADAAAHDGHLPAGELHQPGALVLVIADQRGLQHGRILCVNTRQ
jgi:hypothetical protein